MTYDGLGRLTSRTDYRQGHYDEDKAMVATWTYDEAANGLGQLHEVTQRTGVDRTGYSYQRSHAYDLAGRESVTTLTVETDQYVSRKQVSSIAKGTHTTTFAYGPDRARITRTDVAHTHGGRSTTTTVYLGHVEHVIAGDGRSKYKRYLANGAVLITQNYDTLATRTAQATHYLLRDHLGSLTGTFDQYGVIDQSFSYDAWGQRRNPTSAAMLATLTLSSTTHTRTTTRGYTGHEMLDAVGIIHMNGRIYDPTLGRFLQADPIIQFPHYSQGWNTYSYVLNNPLTHTDPSGYFIGKLFRKVVGGLINGIFGELLFSQVPVLRQFSTLAHCALGNALTCATAAAGNAYAGGTSLKRALKTGLFAYVSAQAFTAVNQTFTGAAGTGLARGGVNHFLATALTGGVLTELQGGQFGHGFLAAGSGFAVGHVGAAQGWRTEARFVARVVSAGTVSEITGGKFANGAMTAAFSRLFELAHEQKQKQKDGFFAKLGRALNLGKIREFATQAVKGYENGDPLAHEKAAHGYGRYVGSPAIVAVTRTIGEIGQFVGYGVETLTFGAVNILAETHNPFTLDYLRDAVRDVEITIQGAQGKPFTEVVPGSGDVP